MLSFCLKLGLLTSLAGGALKSLSSFPARRVSAQAQTCARASASPGWRQGSASRRGLGDSIRPTDAHLFPARARADSYQLVRLTHVPLWCQLCLNKLI